MATFLKRATFSNNTHFALELYYDLTQDLANNKSIITYLLYIKVDPSYSGRGGAGSGLINDSQVGTFTYLGSGDNYIGSQTVEVIHNNDGEKTVSYTAYASAPWNNFGSASISGDLALPTIPRYFSQTPSLSAASTSETSVACSWTTSENCSGIQYTLDNGGSWTTVSMSAATSGTFNISNLSAGGSYTILARFTRQDSGLTTDASTNVTTYSYPYIISTTPSANSVWSLSDTSRSIGAEIYNPLGRKIKLSLSVDSTTGYLLYRSGETVASTVEATIEKSNLNDHITNAMSARIYYWLQYSLDNGTTYIDSDVVKYNTYQLRASDCKPTLSDFSTGDANSVTLAVMEDDGATLVQNQSILKIRVQSSNYSLKSNATVASITANIGNQTYNLNTDDSWTSLGVFNYSSSTSVSVTLTDSRGQTATKTKSVNFIAYEPPKVSVKASRTGGYGTNASFTVVASYTSLNGKNSWWNNFSHSIRYLITPSPTTPASSGVVGQLNNINETINITGADNDLSYTIVIYANDKISTWIYATATIGQGQPTFTVLVDNQTVGVNYVPPVEKEPGLYINGSLNVDTIKSFGGNGLSIEDSLTNKKINVLEQGSRNQTLNAEAGTSGYIHAFEIINNLNYIDQTIQFDILQRETIGHVEITFKSLPTVGEMEVDTIYKTGPINVYYNCENDIFDFYIEKAEAWDDIEIVNLSLGSYMSDRISLNWINELVTALPSTAVQVSNGGYLLSTIYPIGSVYFTNNINPNTAFGGTWSNIGSITVGTTTVQSWLRTA